MPSVLALDVNETLSDMGALSGPLSEVGASGEVLPTWFASTLRDGFALAATGGYADFATIADATLRSLLAHEASLRCDPDEASRHVLATIGGLPLHDDVARGLERLHAAGIRLITLTNGSAATARQLLENGGVAGCIEQFLSVEQVGHWKPDHRAYRFAAEACGVPVDALMLVAVHPWDIHGAKSAGLEAAWINRDGGSYPEFFSTPELTCASFETLADALAGTRAPGADCR
jgi:2-haloacid dehalogenase